MWAISSVLNKKRAKRGMGWEEKKVNTPHTTSMQPDTVVFFDATLCLHCRHLTPAPNTRCPLMTAQCGRISARLLAQALRIFIQVCNEVRVIRPFPCLGELLKKKTKVWGFFFFIKKEPTTTSVPVCLVSFYSSKFTYTGEYTISTLRGE